MKGIMKDGTIVDTAKSTLLAEDWDGGEQVNATRGTDIFYREKNGKRYYFVRVWTRWQGEQGQIKEIDVKEAAQRIAASRMITDDLPQEIKTLLEG